MTLGADYSDARPGGAALAAAGVSAVGRYLAADSRGITSPERQDLTNHGVGIWLVREGGSTNLLSGYAQGVADAQIAAAQIQAAGLPADSVVYAAADFDVQSSQFPACDAYMQGFASVLGSTARVGIYGGLHYLNHCHAAGLATRFWRAAATSWDHGEAPAMTIHLQQTTNTPPVPGTDHDYILDPAFASVGAVTPITNEDDMKLRAIRNWEGSIALIDDAGLLTPLTSLGEWNSYLRLGIVEQNADGSFFLQQGDGTVWNALAGVTARVHAQQAGDAAALAKATAALLIPAVLSAVQQQPAGAQLTLAEVTAASEAAIKAVLADAAK